MVEEKKHPTFEREGNDLIKTVVVDLHEALLGHKIFVSTLDGKSINVDVPEIVGPRFEKKLIGEGEYFPFTTFRRLNAHTRLTFFFTIAGMPLSKTPNAKGDMRIKFDIRFPKKLTDEQRQVLKTCLEESEY